MATIWLHFLRQNKNCSQEFVQSTHRVHANCCYSNKYVELCSVVTEVYPANISIFWLHFYQKLATIIEFWLQLSLPRLQLNNSSANENHFQSSLLFQRIVRLTECRQGLHERQWYGQFHGKSYVVDVQCELYEINFRYVPMPTEPNFN